MKKGSIAERVASIITPVIEELDLEVYDVEYLKEGPGWYLRIYIDKEKGVGLEDCERASKKVERVLDEYDEENGLFPGSYTLEVSSPGIDRPLKKEKDFQRYQGHMITVKTYGPINGKKKFKGILLKRSAEGIELEIEGIKLTIPNEKISSARLAIDF